jgi:uncharacterized membrane protein
MSSDNGRTMVIVAYVLHLLGACTGLLSIIALIMNYVCKGDHGDLADSHHTWMIRTFWFTFLAFFICFVLVITIIGIPLAWLLGLAAWLWYIYRHVKGIIFLMDDKPMSATAWV